MQEIERKFLVNSDAFKLQAKHHYPIRQGFLNTDPARTVRVRVTGNKGFLTVKGLSESGGLKRFEWEKVITATEAESLLVLCEPGQIIKERYLVPVGQHMFEVDVFEGENRGLVIAEIELNTEDEVFEKPFWLGEEVTGQVRYYNVQLAQKPFALW